MVKSKVKKLRLRCNPQNWPGHQCNPKKKTEPRTVFSTKVETWRSHGEKAYCPICKKAVVPVVLEKRRRFTSSGFIAICLLGCWPLCVVPLKADSALMIKCPVCGYKYGVKEITPSKASSASTLSNPIDVYRHPSRGQLKSHRRTPVKIHEGTRKIGDSAGKFETAESSAQTHSAEKIHHSISSNCCGCFEGNCMKRQSYQLEQFKYKHHHQPLKSTSRFSQHSCNPQTRTIHDTIQLPLVTMSHEESTESILSTTRLHGVGVRQTESTVYGKNCRESACNEDEAYNHSDWTGDDCRIRCPVDACCQGRFQSDAN